MIACVGQHTYTWTTVLMLLPGVVNKHIKHVPRKTMELGILSQKTNSGNFFSYSKSLA